MEQIEFLKKQDEFDREAAKNALEQDLHEDGYDVNHLSQRQILLLKKMKQKPQGILARAQQKFEKEEIASQII